MNGEPKPKLRIAVEIGVVLIVAVAAYFGITRGGELTLISEKAQQARETFTTGIVESVGANSLELLVQRGGEDLLITVTLDAKTAIYQLDTLQPEKQKEIAITDIALGDVLTITTESAVGNNTTLYAQTIIKI